MVIIREAASLMITIFCQMSHTSFCLTQIYFTWGQPLSAKNFILPSFSTDPFSYHFYPAQYIFTIYIQLLVPNNFGIHELIYEST